ncbi:MAG: hypothetical protein HOG73_10855 [Candidatus Marinimicrobia bacterium]|jgi:hypothetical protein|nr:hypothetical protein [Candidatus Neomarinimicrobiota bacterium]MBT5386019.1 hypothetical protein [Candidatus Neomarinimicrobiota bacterium]MBT5776429.1 hypothetical protein [Candidatus Neomarinimicrobiota bacterium]MBT5996203.1 hypothetical protein [Candidatus Neomarinimicrobiota bacterium]MBT7922024.1 hypothetical protein [Candidatus Neomarinimicrobiota bacterium]|tara:strand:+ start:45 stop:419 length:375 start_codon:yes stop_codon:yes gene_type:complete
MNLNTLFKINVFVSGLFGLGFVLAPEATLTPYGLSQEIIDGSVMIARWFGGANIGYAILSWMMSNSQDSDAKTTVAKAYSIGFGISFLISIQNQLSGEINFLGWSTVIIFAAFSIAFGKFAFKK